MVGVDSPCLITEVGQEGSNMWLARTDLEQFAAGSNDAQNRFDGPRSLDILKVLTEGCQWLQVVYAVNEVSDGRVGNPANLEIRVALAKGFRGSATPRRASLHDIRIEARESPRAFPP